MSQASNLERQMLDLINEERTSRGLEAVELELRLNESSEDHSQWMLDEDQFSHTGENGSSAGDRMRDANFAFEGNWSWGENIAFQSERGAPGLADDVEDLHNSLMNSPGHRANILNPNYEVVGLGIETGDFDGFDAVMVTQNFASTDADLQIDNDTTTSDPRTSPEPVTGDTDTDPDPEEPTPDVVADGPTSEPEEPVIEEPEPDMPVTEDPEEDDPTPVADGPDTDPEEPTPDVVADGPTSEPEEPVTDEPEPDMPVTEDPEEDDPTPVADGPDTDPEEPTPDMPTSDPDMPSVDPDMPGDVRDSPLDDIDPTTVAQLQFFAAGFFATLTDDDFVFSWDGPDGETPQTATVDIDALFESIFTMPEGDDPTDPENDDDMIATTDDVAAQNDSGFGALEFWDSLA